MSGGLNLRSTCKIFTVLSIGFLLVSLTCLSQPQVESLKQELKVSPPGVLTAPFRVKNKSDRTRTYVLTLELPEGWRVVNLSSEISLQPHSSKLILASFRVPGNFRAGDYSAKLQAQEPKKESPPGGATITVSVESRVSLSLVVTTESGGAIPDGSANYGILVKNRGNVQTKFKLRESSSWPVNLSSRELNLQPGRERKVRITHMIPPDATPGTFESLYIEVYTPSREDVEKSAQFLTEVLPPPPDQITRDLGLPLQSSLQWKESFNSEGDRNRQFSFVGSGGQSDSSVALNLSGDNFFESEEFIENIYLAHSAAGYTLELGDITKSPGTFISGSGRGLSLKLNRNDLLGAEFFYLPNQHGTDEGMELKLHNDNLTSSFSLANLAEASRIYSIYEISIDALTTFGTFRGNYASALQTSGSYRSFSYRWNGDNAGGNIELSYTDPPFLDNNNSELDFSISTGIRSNVLNFWTNLTEEFTWNKNHGDREEGQFEIGGRYILDRHTRFRLELTTGWERGDLGTDVDSLSQELNFKLDQFWLGNSFTFQGSLKKELDREIKSNKWTNHLQAKWGPDLKNISLNFFSGFQKTFSNTEAGGGKFTGGFNVRDRSSNYSPFLSVSLTHEDKNWGFSSELELEPSSEASLTLTGETTGSGPKYSISVNKDFSLTYPWLQVKGQLSGIVFVDDNTNGIYENNEKTPKGLVLSLPGTKALTDKNGKYRFVPSKPGQYELEFVNLPPKYVPMIDLPRNIRLKSGERKSVNIPIVEASSIVGTLIKVEDQGEKKKSWQLQTRGNSEGGEGIEGVRIRVKAGDRTFSTTTDGEGEFRINGLRPGSWTVRVVTDDLPSLYSLKKEKTAIKLDPGEKKTFTVMAFKKERDIQELELGDDELELEDDE